LPRIVEFGNVTHKYASKAESAVVEVTATETCPTQRNDPYNQ
jgi:hypothetical protein